MDYQKLTRDLILLLRNEREVTAELRERLADAKTYAEDSMYAADEVAARTYRSIQDLLVYLRQCMEESKTDRMLQMAAQLAWEKDVLEPEMIEILIGTGKKFADKQDWIDSWLTTLEELVENSPILLSGS